MGRKGSLDRITRADLEPLWNRRDVPIRRMAEALGVARSTLTVRAMELGLPPRGGARPKRRKADFAMFRRLWDDGASPEEIRQRLGYANVSTVYERARRQSCAPRSGCA